MGLRERKKQKTRLALIDAALDLFLARGYEATTIDQIAASVDVSPRTFFRYFASKEDVALALQADALDIFVAELSARPDAESPFTAMSQAMRAALATVGHNDEADHERFAKTCELRDRHPALVAGQARLMMAHEQRLLAEITRRRGADDLRSHFVLALFAAVARTCFEQCGPGEIRDVAALARRLDETLVVAGQSLRPGWDE
ncbi:TetR family transcriptional regulator [Acrocarpospora phusangensis]|uniref:TetR family transcriptional regulator n=1 Tax=Acrocarpospora phusangensis TaxID=1070424 RepID=A0A919UT31_9ACTN|nr:TetR family transcriptional regulator [Acrocarpospora phusangensis]GIH27050.1 TetR family transcriptional regulator [Acrocarpospora phusangensis]